MAAPSSYRTLPGLLAATERVLQARLRGVLRADGMSAGMWLHNAEFVSKETFGNATAVQDLRRKYSQTRAQDLLGGHSLFGVPLPTREYIVKDVIPGVGVIDEIVGEQYFIGGQWFHKRCFESATQSRSIGD